MRPPPGLAALALAAAFTPAAPGGEAARDLVFLAEDRPVFLRLVVTAGGAPFDAAWPASVRALHATLDRNGDGVVTAKEATAADLGALVRLAAGGAAPVAAVDPDAAPKDGVVSVEELAEAVRPALGPFRLQAVGLNGGRTDALFDHLDRDKDERLTRTELAAATGSLRRLDLDDNEMITADELEPFLAPAPAARPDDGSGRRSRFSALPAVVERAAGESSLRLGRLLMKKYDKGPTDAPGRPDNRLSAAEFAIEPAAFAAADANADGVLDPGELRRFLDGPPVDATVAVDFPAEGPATARAGGGTRAEGVEVRPLGAGDVECAAGRVRIDVRADDGSAAAGDARRALRRRFRAADANNDGYLEGKERAAENAQGSPLAGLTGVVDRDGDGKVTLKELNAFVDRQAEAARGRLVVTASDQGRALFRILDSDRDRRLGAREVMRAADRVASWDGDGDGLLGADEIPYHFQVTVARGGLDGLAAEGPAGAGPRPADGTRPAAGPAWFRKTDRNRDGDVSRREFLGPREQFDRLDRDADGLIDAAEADRAGSGPPAGGGSR